MEKIEVPSFVNKMDEKQLESLLSRIENGEESVFVVDSDELDILHKNIKLNYILRKKDELSAESCAHKQISEREKLFIEKTILEQIVYARKIYKRFLDNSQFIKAHRTLETINAFYEDLRKLNEILTFSNVYAIDGVDSLVDTIRNMEYKNRAK